jgi:2-polyprenyl-6-methoxyphenol hydroxylase-like FAD-dependent oxidoreductase
MNKTEQVNFSKAAHPNAFTQTTGTAIVVGASLAGLMASLSLARAGLHVTLLERGSANPPSGALLQVDGGDEDRTGTAKALRQLASGGLRAVEAWSAVHGRLSAEVRATPTIEVRYNTRIEAIDQDPDAAWVVTETGEMVRGDIVIGADGYRSTVRRHVAPHRPDATFTGYLIWVGLIDEQDIPAKYRPGRNPSLAMPQGLGDFLLGSVIAGRDGSHEMGHRRLGWAWYDNTRNDLLRRLGCVAGDVVQHSLTGPNIPEQTLQELSKQAAARWPQPWLAATQHSIQTRNLIGLPIAEYVPNQLVNGRLALVGDAGHVLTPLTATGFNASLQDAAALAECVAQGIQGPTAAAALLDYEARRLSVVRRLVQGGQSFSRSFGR